MVQYNRLTSETGIVDYIKGLERKIAQESTRGTGDIVISDPDTGVETIIGTLPDGTTGLQQFVGDIEPPPVATVPIVAAQPGNFIVSWDGLFEGGMTAPRDFVHVNVVGHKMDGDVTLSSGTVGVIRLSTESVLVSTDVAVGGETWQFSLASEDYNGNVATESIRSATVTMIDALSVVDTAWTDMKSDVAAAQSAAATAQTDAAQASADAQHAIDVANSAGSTYIQDTVPPVAAQTATTLWIDTTNGANTPKRWDGSTWVAITDKAAIDAANAAVAAQTRADQAYNNATSAATSAGNAQTTADSKNRVWYLDTAPTGTGFKVNDIWFDTANDNRLSKWDGSMWVTSLLGNSALFGNIDAGKMSVGYLSASVLKAKSIGVDKLVISSTDNLVVEADFSNSGSSWQLSANNTINATAGRGSLPAMRFTGTTSTITSFNLKNRIPISSDARFRGTMWVKSTAAAASGSYKIVGRFYTTATSYTDITIASSPLLVANTWTNVDGIVPATVPVGTIAVEFYLSIQNAASGTITDIDFVSVMRASDGKLIVDGAIDGKTITGAIVQTAASGARIVLDQTSLNAWNSAGDKYFSMSNDTGVNISSKGKAGYDTTRTNFCTNPSMEVDISGWTSSQTIIRDTTLAYVPAAGASLKATWTATADRIVSRKQNIPVAGDYRFSGWVYHNAATAKTVTAKFYWTDASNVPLTTGGTFAGVATTVQPNTWTRVTSGTSNAGQPGTAAFLRMDIVGTSFLSTENLWIDAVYLEAGNYSTFPALSSYFDGDTPATATTSYVWGSNGGGFGLDVSYEHTDRDVSIKSGGNAVLSADTGAAKVAPGIGFIPPTPFAQTAGLFSDGQTVSLTAGAADPQITRIDVGANAGLDINTNSRGSTSIQAHDSVNINAQMGSLNLSGGTVYINSVPYVSVKGTYTPVLTATTTNPNIGTGVATGSYTLSGKQMIVEFFVPFGTGGSVGSGNYLISLPPGYTYGGLGSAIARGVFVAHLNASADVSGFVRQNVSGGNTITMLWQSATTTASPLTNSTVGWASGSYITGTVIVPVQ